MISLLPTHRVLLLGLAGMACPLWAGWAQVRIQGNVVLGGGGIGGNIALAPKTAVEGSAATVSVTPRLHWRNGESLPGTWENARPGSISWRSPLFQDSVPLKGSYLRLIEMPAPEISTERLGVAALDRGSFAVLLKNGDRVTGDILGTEGNWLRVKSPRHGEVKLNWQGISSLRRLHGAGVIFGGPSGIEGWGAVDTKGGEKSLSWFALEGGSLGTQQWNRSLAMPLKIPDKARIDVVLRASEMPDFSLQLNLGGNPVTIETWDTVVVATQGDRFVPLQTLQKEQDVGFRLCWDHSSRQLACYRWNGEKLGFFTASAGLEGSGKGSRGPADATPAPAPATISLLNKGRDLVLEYFSVREWSGREPSKRNPGDGAAVAEISDGSVWVGAAKPSAKGLVIGGKSLPFEDLIRYDSDTVGTEGSAKSRGAQLRYNDGTVVTGEVSGMAGGQVTQLMSFAEGPVSTRLDGLHRAALIPDTTHEMPAGPPLTELDAIKTTHATLHGTIEGSGDGILRWRPVGGEKPVALAVSSDLEVLRAPSKDPAASAASLLFLDSGDIVSGKLLSISDGTVAFESQFSGRLELASTSVRALHLGARPVDGKGFGDVGWHRVRGDEKLVKQMPEKVEIDNGGAFGHASILQGDEVRFSIGVEAGWGAVGVDLFVEDVESRSEATTVRFFYSGDEMYVLLGSENDGLRGDQSISNLRGEPVKIRILFKGDQLQVFAREKKVLESKIDPRKRKGAGIVFYPAEMWGNAPRKINISEFVMQSNPGYVNLPPVSEEAKTLALTVPRFRRESPPSQMLLAPNGDLLRGTVVSATGGVVRFRSGLEEIDIPLERIASLIWLSPPDPEADAREAAERANTHQVARGETLVSIAKREGVTVDQILKLNHLNNPSIAVGQVLILPAKTPTAGLDQTPQPASAVAAVAGIPINGAEDSKVSAVPTLPKAIPSWQPSHWLVMRDGSQFGLKVAKFSSTEIEGSSPVLGDCHVPFPLLHSLRMTAPAATPALSSYRNWRLRLAPEPVLPESGGQSSELLGKLAPLFKLPMLDGFEFDLAAQRGKTVVLDFWATWCGPCVQSMPGVIEAMKSFSTEKAVFVAVNQAENPAQIKKFLTQRKWELPVALDSNQGVGSKYGVEGIPYQVVISPEGMVVWVNSGFRPGGEEALRKAVQAAIDGTTPTASPE